MWFSVGEVKVGRASLELASPLEAPEATQLSDACWTSMRNRVRFLEPKETKVKPLEDSWLATRTAKPQANKRLEAS